MFPERPRNEKDFEDGEIDSEIDIDIDNGIEVDLDDLIELDELEDLDAEIPNLLAQPPVEPATGSLAAFADGLVTESMVRELNDLSRKAARRLAEELPALPAVSRRRIVEVMEELDETAFDFNFGPAYRVFLRDEDPAVRQLALRAIWGDDSEDLVRPLLGMLANDLSNDVRAEAARTLAPIAFLAETDDLAEELADQVREGLMAVARDENEDPLVQRVALESAAVFGGEEIAELIRDAYDSGEHDRIGSALFAMGRTYDKAWLPILIEELSSDDAHLRYEAARALGTIGSDAAVAELLAAMDGEEDVEVRHAVIFSLGEIGGKSARRALERLAGLAEEADVEAIQDALEEATFSHEELGS